MSTPKIPDAITKTPRCPLCYAAMEKQHNEMIQQRIEANIAELVAEAKRCDSANDRKGREKARAHLELLDGAIKRGITYVFSCRFCRIACAANDPFAGRWEMVYAQVGKEMCPSCDTEMRFFCTATGVAILDCPAKKCRSRIKRSLPDRMTQDNVPLLDENGVEIILPNIQGAVSTPGQLADTVVGDGKAEGLPDVTTILPKNPREGHA